MTFSQNTLMSEDEIKFSRIETGDLIVSECFMAQGTAKTCRVLQAE
jgi:hypothetical protein